MTTFKKILGAAVTAMLATAPIAATAAQPVRPMTSLVSAQGKGIQSGLRTGVAKKGQSAANGRGTALAVGGVILFGGGLYLLLKDDDNDDVVSPD